MINLAGSNWHCSYDKNYYGELFHSLIRIYQPEKVVELGTKDGYSAYHIARGLTANNHGTLDCYDLWETYIENHRLDYASKSAAEKNLEEFKQIINLELSDAVGIDKKYGMVDILHVDLDNDGEILEKIVPFWIDKVRQLIIIEGGSLERDKAASATDYKKLSVAKWLSDLNNKQHKSLKEIFPEQTEQSGQFVIVGGKKEYLEKPIAPWLESLSTRRGDIEYFTIEPFPSVTIIRKTYN